MLIVIAVVLIVVIAIKAISAGYSLYVMLVAPVVGCYLFDFVTLAISTNI